MNTNKVEEYLKKINIRYVKDYAMSLNTSFKIGGPARFYVLPETEEALVKIYAYCIQNRLPYFIMGGGSNILVSDRGLDCIVLHTKLLDQVEFNNNLVSAACGASVSGLSEMLSLRGLAGLEDFYRMPGTVGGAVWINARCYGKSISDCLFRVELINEKLEPESYLADLADFSYKKSPFQNRPCLILKAEFKIRADNKDSLIQKITERGNDREAKGHFLYPCAGSVFKNNRDFGRPSGKIIDSLGFKGFRIGDACVLEKHANIIVNKGSAKAGEIKKIIDIIKDKVKKRYGFCLEEEILYIGRF